jgi:hypothetical protein
MNVRWDLLLSAALAAACAPTTGKAVAQTAAPQVGGAQSAAVPNISGMWAYQTCCGFEPPLSGPGPVMNSARRNGLSDRFRFVGDYTNPILKPRAADVVRRHGEIELSGVTHPTPRNQCWPEGVPFIFANSRMELLQQPDKITIIYDFDHQVRHVRLDQPHPAHLTPSWYGDSVGHYDGDTLVIDTVGIKIGPFSMIDWYGTPYSEALHVVERYRLIGYKVANAAEERRAREYPPIRADVDQSGNGLQLQFTVEDDGVFTMPWSATITYRHLLDGWPEFSCAENLHRYVSKHAPTADKPDF